MVHVRRAARLAFASVASVLALLVMVAAPQPASADSGAMVVPITSVEGVTGQVGAYCRSGLPHTGIDISANTGDPVYSAYGGTLQRFTQASLGTHIIVTHVDGYSTLYAHLSGFAAGAPDGSTVSTGQLIGYAGTTGNSTGVHLHFEVRLNGVSQSGINAAFPCGSHTLALTPIAWSFPGLPAVGPEPLDNLAVYRPANSTFYVRAANGAMLRSARFGTTGDLPVVGHFGDSTVDNLAVYRPSTSTFYVRGVNGALLGSVKFGRTGDLPVVGHFQDSLNDNVAVYRPSSSTFYIRAHGGALLSSTRFGRTGDLPVVGRFEDAPVDNLAVYRPSNSTFYVRALDGSLLTTIKYGAAGDLPVVGHLQGSAPDNLGRFRPSSATFAIRAHGGSLLTSVAFGKTGDRPLAGRFQ